MVTPYKNQSKDKKAWKSSFFSFESKHLRLLFVILLIVFTANSILAFLLGKNFLFLKTAQKTTISRNSFMVTGVPIGEEAYIERGSPLDKRSLNPTIGLLEDKIVFHGPRTKKEIALTFDAEMTDGMKQAFLKGHPSYDKRIIDVLEKTQTKATLFLTGMWVQLYPQEAYSLGHNSLFEIASHSYADTSYDGYCYGLKQVPDSQDLEEIESAQKIIHDTIGIESKYFRFPGGCYSANDLNVVENQAHLTVVHWDVVGADGFNQSASNIAFNVIDNVQNGSIVVLHLNGAPTAPKTADALPQIISTLRAKGFSFVTVSELLSK